MSFKSQLLSVLFVATGLILSQLILEDYNSEFLGVFNRVLFLLSLNVVIGLVLIYFLMRKEGVSLDRGSFLHVGIFSTLLLFINFYAYFDQILIGTSVYEYFRLQSLSGDVIFLLFFPVLLILALNRYWYKISLKNSELYIVTLISFFFSVVFGYIFFVLVEFMIERLPNNPIFPNLGPGTLLSAYLFSFLFANYIGLQVFNRREKYKLELLVFGKNRNIPIMWIEVIILLLTLPGAVWMMSFFQINGFGNNSVFVSFVFTLLLTLPFSIFISRSSK